MSGRDRLAAVNEIVAAAEGPPALGADMSASAPGADRRPCQADAVINGPYRYNLTRIWANPDRPRLCGWAMLNPSVADAQRDDQTVRRCRAYSTAWGFDGLIIRNLFAWRATDPAELARVDDPVGPDNDTWLSSRWDGVERLIVAWGGGRYPEIGQRWRHVADLLAPLRPLCLRTTAAGQPVHPLRQRADLLPAPWPIPPIPADRRTAPSQSTRKA
ncbi:DUF1643 domain-containing protein [Nonomuraea sp. NPDC026600]|uniref:DUF1643 domain-containing protein n=1 Tax=Nonomuraea sp. NPDC026600 TaxID=3155363 RepID=UPI0033EFC0BC